MSIFPKMTLTNKGIALQAKLQIGDTMEFTRMGLGSGELNKPIAELLNLINETASVLINNKQIIQEYTVQLRAFFTNVDVQERFYWREFGVFANDPDEGEILYAYSNAGDMGGWIPAVTDNRIERMIYASVRVSNAGEINITIPQSDTFIPTSEKGQPNGVATLDEHGNVEQMPELDFYSKEETLANDTKTLFGLDVSALPDDVFKLLYNNVLDIKNSFVVGSYTGNNIYPRTIDLGFKPKVVFITGGYLEGWSIFSGAGLPFKSDRTFNYDWINISENGFEIRVGGEGNSNESYRRLNGTNSNVVGDGRFAYFAVKE